MVSAGNEHSSMGPGIGERVSVGFPFYWYTRDAGEWHSYMGWGADGRGFVSGILNSYAEGRSGSKQGI